MTLSANSVLRLTIPESGYCPHPILSWVDIPKRLTELPLVEQTLNHTVYHFGDAASQRPAKCPNADGPTLTHPHHQAVFQV